jgi:hypothetical protein
MTRRISLLPIAFLVAGCASTPTTSPATSVAPESPSPTATAVASASPSSSAAPSASVPVWMDPANFTTTIDNPWLPLIPGTVMTYHGTKDGEPAVETFTVTSKTKVINGVTCVVIDDRLKLSGVLEEKTFDYYVQDLGGNVWYFGEDTQELNEQGKVVSTEGTWHAGVDGAIPGIFMPAEPKVGDTFQQEYYKGHAEDLFQVLDLSASVKVPFGSFSNALLTKEWTPLEPNVLDNKFYVRGVGEVKEASVKGPVERLELIKVVKP